MPDIDRRAFLKATSISAMCHAAPLGMGIGLPNEASAQTANDYKALVCVYLGGGNDAYNTVLATDADSWRHYTNHRLPTDGSSQLALPLPGTPGVAAAAPSSPLRLGGVLPIGRGNRAVHASRQFALHPALTHVQSLYQAGRLAVLANVGPLCRPTSKADWSNDRMAKPSKLFSHNDQYSTWLSFRPEGASAGWGGLMGDLLMSQNGTGLSEAHAAIVRRSFTCMSPTAVSVWLAGQAVHPFQTGASNVLTLGNAGSIFGHERLHTAVANIMGRVNSNGRPLASPTNLFAEDHQGVVQRALQANELLGGSLAPLGQAPWSTPGATSPQGDALLRYISPVDRSLKFNPLALQLQMVARLIDTNRTAGLGIKRQLFMVYLGAFDTHDNQIAEHGDRMAQLNHALSYFDKVLGGMSTDMRSQVTTFTASDFGRTFTSNGDGTDHGWGGHHFVMGGAVNGAEVYGSFPEYGSADSAGVFSSPNQIQNGVLLPTTSVDHMAYTLGKWMGVPTDTLTSGMLPNLAQFASDGHDLGFMRG
jgi:uncharacterized protein (DUF1501 family)